MAQAALGDVINFFEANPAHADTHLTQLWAVMADIKKLSKNSAKQSTKLDLDFKKNYIIIFYFQCCKHTCRLTI